MLVGLYLTLASLYLSKCVHHHVNETKPTMGYSREYLLSVRDCVSDISLLPQTDVVDYVRSSFIAHDQSLLKRPRGRRAGINKRRPINVHISARNEYQSGQHGVNHENLHAIKSQPYNKPWSQKQLQMCVINTQSIAHKADEMVLYITENDIDVCLITESWLHENESEKVLEDLKPTGYDLKHVPRKTRKGGGIAVIYKLNIKVQVLDPILHSDAFEHMELLLQSGNGRMRIVIIYRPQRPDPDLEYTVPLSVFLRDFSDVVRPHLVRSGHLIVTGDINLHVDILDDPNAKRLLNDLSSMQLVQHVKEPTHISGHTLDLVITRKTEASFISDLHVDAKISDHYSVLFKAGIQKPPPIRKEITFRKYRNINIDEFKRNLRDRIESLEPDHSVEGLVDRYNRTLSELIDIHAPEVHRTVTVRHHTPWFNDDIRQEREDRRRLEVQWRRNKTIENEDAFKHQRNKVEIMCTSAKRSFYLGILNDNKGNPKGMFKVIDTLLNRKQSQPLPPHDSAKTLANDFADFFIGKIETIRAGLESGRDPNQVLPVEEKRYHTELSTFKPTTIDELRTIIIDSPVTSCQLDPAPSWLVKNCLTEVLPLLVTIVNLSLQSGHMPASLKQALILPLLKKAILELILKHFRPVSNLTYLSKIVERVAAK